MTDFNQNWLPSTVF